MKILLWKTGALGDVLMTTPLIRQLRRAWPQARIDYLTGRGCAGLLHGNPHLDAVIGFDERILYGAQVRRLGEVLPLLRGYDRIFILDKHWIFGWLAWLARAPQRTGFQRRPWEGWPHTQRVPYGPLRHEIDCYLDLAERAGVVVDRDDRALQAQAGRACEVPPRYTVLINSGGANAHEQSQVRRMPAALFRQLCDARRAAGALVFLGAPAEHAYYEDFRAPGDSNLCGRTDLAQAAAVLAAADAVISTDTGLMHLAAAMGSPLTAVFGPTHPLRKCPPGARWVWKDQDRYDDRYEVFGRVPVGNYFDRLELADLLQP